MSLETARSFLLWCSLINYGVLILWAWLTIFARGFYVKTCSRLYHLSEEQFTRVNFSGLLYYKTGIILLYIVPCIALHLVK